MPITDIGLIMVHGIGDQRRFEHVNAHLRGVIQGLRRAGAAVTVEILGAPSGMFQAAQDTWAGGPGPSVRLTVRHGEAVTRINVHEVWWADVNEPYSLMKQIRFWLWGLAIWRFNPFASATLPTHGSMFPPRYGSPQEWHAAIARARVRLFGLGCFFLVASLTVGVATVLLKRLLNLDPFDFIRVFANYLSSVKLYIQPHRKGADFLDNTGIPPRFSIRRRMVRTIADVACQHYERWHILAHSQGAVVAFNGLMEPAYGWPGYLDEARWDVLKARDMAGPAGAGAPPPQSDTTPPRPVWLAPDQIVYRRRVFEKFAGILTYGCPLEKFAAIWPATVAVCREPAFGKHAAWLNVFDPLDPVSGEMIRWPTEDHDCIPKPQNVGYASAPVLLVGHTQYLACSAPAARPALVARQGPAAPDDGWRLADGVAQWLLTHATDGVLKSPGGRFFPPDGRRAHRRKALAWAQWGAAFLLATLLGALVVPELLRLLGHAALALLRHFGFHAGAGGLAASLRSIALQPWYDWLLILPFTSLVATMLAGLASRPGPGPHQGQTIPRNEKFTAVASPDPPSHATQALRPFPIKGRPGDPPCGTANPRCSAQNAPSGPPPPP